MEFIAFAISVPGVTLLLIGWVVWIQVRRRRLRRYIEAHPCAICGIPFSEALFEDRGAPSAAILAKLDMFQRRFAHRCVLCLDCGSLNVCAKDGTPFRGFPEG